MHAAILETLEYCAEQDLDLNDQVFEAFYRRCDVAEKLMSNTDRYMRGRMLDQVFELIMDEPNQIVEGYLSWELENHLLAYSVPFSTYQPLLLSVWDAVRGALGSNWRDHHEQAWSARTKELLERIEAKALQIS